MHNPGPRRCVVVFQDDEGGAVAALANTLHARAAGHLYHVSRYSQVSKRDRALNLPIERNACRKVCRVISATFADDKSLTKPTCCAKHTYCCTIKASCCGKDATEEIVPLTFVKDEAAKPTCCDKRAYCCTVKSPCCGKTLELEIVR